MQTGQRAWRRFARIATAMSATMCALVLRAVHRLPKAPRFDRRVRRTRAQHPLEIMQGMDRRRLLRRRKGAPQPRSVKSKHASDDGFAYEVRAVGVDEGTCKALPAVARACSRPARDRGSLGHATPPRPAAPGCPALQEPTCSAMAGVASMLASLKRNLLPCGRGQRWSRI